MYKRQGDIRTIDVIDGEGIYSMEIQDSESSDEVRIIDKFTGGEKGEKLDRYDLIPPEFEKELAVHYGRGARKYTKEVTISQARDIIAKLCTCPASSVGSCVEAAIKESDAWVTIQKELEQHQHTCKATRNNSFQMGGSTGLIAAGDRNWERGYKWHLSYRALRSHLNAWQRGETYDQETGSHHLVCAAWHCICLFTFEMRGLGMDDVRLQKPLDMSRQEKKP